MNILSISPTNASTAIRKGVALSKNFLIKNAPVIFAGMAIGGVVTTAIMSYKAGIKATDILKQMEEEKYTKRLAEGIVQDVEIPLKEKILACWRVFVPAVISGSLTIGAIIISTRISQKRQAALAGLYAISEASLKEYQKKVEETIGPKKEQDIRDSINADRVGHSDTPPWDDSILPSGDVWCYDKLTGRYFFSSTEKIGRAVAEINEMIYGGDMCASLNEFYGILDNDKLKPCQLGESVGWNIDFNCKPYFTATLMSNMKPCLVLDWSSGHEPDPRYRDI